MSNGYANIDSLIGLHVRVNATGMDVVDLPSVIDAAWVTQDDHIKVLCRIEQGEGIGGWMEFFIQDIKFMKPGSEVTAAELTLALGGQKIDAIKFHRARTGVGLKESKDAIEAAMIKNGAGPGLPTGPSTTMPRAQCVHCGSYNHSTFNHQF